MHMTELQSDGVIATETKYTAYLNNITQFSFL